jgi:recombination protein RecA
VRLGQGRENSKQFLVDNKDVAEEIRQAVLQNKGLVTAKPTVESVEA